MTRNIHSMTVEGQYELEKINPAGFIFLLRFFLDAEGCEITGQPEKQFSWFQNFFWQVVNCARCSAHLGWFFSAAGESGFFALVVDALSDGDSD